MSNPFILLFRILLPVAIIGGVIFLIVFLIKGAKKKGSDTNYVSLSHTETSTTTTTSTSSSYSGTSKIFINGGAPSGNTMGKISVDGKSLSVLYTDAPIEITIPTGRHHVVVEGGVYGDARIDRYIDFGVLDVWTVDLPGRDDADVIRHQMISSSEYRRALSDSGYHVTKKYL
ncbi:MAG: hypothetical protein E7480_01180 [Ruminococcaceae bacterium]|nr:hypothetical protein [Oscillospiraceae bacterium]